MPNGSKNYVFTLHQDERWLNTDIPYFNVFDQMTDVKFIVVGKEIAPSTGSIHYQGYVQFDRRLTRVQVSDKFLVFNPHLEVAVAGPDENITYCTKQNEFYRRGEPVRPGRRRGETNTNALLACAAQMTVGATWDCWQRFPDEMLKHHKAVGEYQQLARKRKMQEAGFNADKKIVVLWGATGAGKTSYAMRWNEDPHETFVVSCSTTGFWWDGYDGENTVVIDEFRGDMPLNQFLRILDGWQVDVAVKGAMKVLMAQTIFITSNHPPEMWYQNVSAIDKAALMRRINYVYRFYGATRDGLIAQEKPQTADDMFIPEAQFVVEHIINEVNLVN